jgi:RNA-binding protein
MVGPMNSRQRKYLRSRAHRLKPVVFVGKGGASPEIVKAADLALEDHELIKIKFNDHKGRKAALAEDICRLTAAHLVGIIGHVAIVYRPARDPAKRAVTLP